jgi:AcrR family transcriptional regulator
MKRREREGKYAMARNKYPEITVERILEASQRLFLEKGYDNTTIQDIVDELGGLTKGAVYHHFKSKEEILDAVSDRMFFSNNPFEAVRKRTDLSGLEKLREAIRINQRDRERTSLTIQAIPITQNPKLLVEMISSNRKVLTPYFLELLEEGNRDGSIHTEYARELAELLPLLTSLWMLPSVFPAVREEIRHKFRFLLDMLEKMGVPLLDDSLWALVNEFVDQIPEEK